MKFTFSITSPSAGSNQGKYETDKDTQSLLSDLDKNGESQCFMAIFFLGLSAGRIKKVK